MELSNRYMKNNFSRIWIVKRLKEFSRKYPKVGCILKFWLCLHALKENQEFVRIPLDAYKSCKDAYITAAPAVGKVTAQYIDSQILASRVHNDSQPLVFEGTSAVTAGTTFVFTAKT